MQAESPGGLRAREQSSGQWRQSGPENKPRADHGGTLRCKPPHRVV